MNKYKKYSRICTILSILLFGALCVVVGYQFSALQWGSRYAGWSAPPSVAFLYALPFAIGMLLCILLARVFHKKLQTKNRI